MTDQQQPQQEQDNRSPYQILQDEMAAAMREYQNDMQQVQMKYHQACHGASMRYQAIANQQQAAPPMPNAVSPMTMLPGQQPWQTGQAQQAAAPQQDPKTQELWNQMVDQVMQKMNDPKNLNRDPEEVAKEVMEESRK